MNFNGQSGTDNSGIHTFWRDVLLIKVFGLYIYSDINLDNKSLFFAANLCIDQLGPSNILRFRAAFAVKNDQDDKLVTVTL